MCEPGDAIKRFAAQGTAQAFEQFVRGTSGPLLRFLVRLLGSCDRLLLEEITQSVYIAAAQRASSYKGPSALAWLFGIAFREVLSYRRAAFRMRAREVIVSEEELAGLRAAQDSKTSQPEKYAQRQEHLELLKQALESLELRDRLPLELVYLEGLSYKEAARVLSLPQGTVKSRIHRALQTLRRSLGPLNAAPCISLLIPPNAERIGPEIPLDAEACAGSWISSALRAAAAGSGAARASTSYGISALAGKKALAVCGAAVALLLALGALWLLDSVSGSRGSEVEKPRELALPQALAGQPLSRAENSGPEKSLKKPASKTALPGRRVEKGYVWVRGVVFDAQGRPFQGVSLRLDNSCDQVRHFPGDPIQFGKWLRAYCVPALSGADGSFEVAFPVRGPAEKHLRSEDRRIASTEHYVHLIATAPDGRVRRVRLHTRPVDPPYVEISFAPLGRIKGQLLWPSEPPSGADIHVVGVFYDERPGRYDYFVRTGVSPDGSFELKDLEPGRWLLYILGLPQSWTLKERGLACEVLRNQTTQVSIPLKPKETLSGRISSPGGYGVFGATLRLLDASGLELQRLSLPPTTKLIDLTSGKPVHGRKALPEGLRLVLDISAEPTPFGFTAATPPGRYTLVLENPEGGPSETFGPFPAPAQDLELRSNWEPGACVVVKASNPEKLAPCRGRVVLFSGDKEIASKWMRLRAGEEGTPSSYLTAFFGLPSGEYAIEVTVEKQSRGISAYLRGVSAFELKPKEEKEVEVDFGVSCALQVVEDRTLHRIRAQQQQNIDPHRYFLAVPLQGRGGPQVPFTPVKGYGESDGKGRINFYLPEGKYAFYLPVEQPGGETPGKFIFGSVMLVEVNQDSCCVFKEPRPVEGRIRVTVENPFLRVLKLSLEGTTTEGLPVTLKPFPGDAGRFEIKGLPPGMWRLRLVGPDPLEPGAAKVFRYQGGDIDIAF